MFCRKCGAEINGSQFCPKCGAAADGVSDMKIQSHIPALAENVAGVLCYLLGWITGIVFLIIDKRPTVRFHAMQSILAFGALSVLTFLLNRVLLLFSYTIWSLLNTVNTLLSVGGLVLALFLMIQTYKGKRYSLPIVGSIAERLTTGSGIESK